MSTTSTFGERFREIRREENRTLKDVADILGCSIPFVSEIERSNRLPIGRDLITKVMIKWGREDVIDELVELAMVQRGEFQRAPKNRNEQRVLVALERAFESGPTPDQYQELLRLLASWRTDEQSSAGRFTQKCGEH